LLVRIGVIGVMTGATRRKRKSQNSSSLLDT
jgi:hypothetical protein